MFPAALDVGMVVEQQQPGDFKGGAVMLRFPVVNEAVEGLVGHFQVGHFGEIERERRNPVGQRWVFRQGGQETNRLAYQLVVAILPVVGLVAHEEPFSVDGVLGNIMLFCHAKSQLLEVAKL